MIINKNVRLLCQSSRTISPKKNPFNETVNCHTVTLERKNGLWKLLSVTLYCKSWCRLNTPCQSGVVSECGYMFWRMRDSKALKKDHHYNKYSDGLYLNNCFYYRWSNGRSEMIRPINNNC